MARHLSLLPLVVLLFGLALPAAAQSRRGELRGAWMGEGYNRDWPAIMKSLKDNGFNAIFPNFSVGDMAYYPSRVLPAARGATPGRDELAEAVRAAKQNGIELHLWRINWALWRVPQETLDKLETEGRLQRNAKGQLGRDDTDAPPEARVDWLCPSNPQNRKLEKDAMLEVVRSYDIAGIHFDYMRFPNGAYCFCDNCKAQFQKDAKVAVAHWPDEVQDGGPYAAQWRAWRRGLITSLAEDISEACHRVKPQVRVSLAAWPDLNAAYNEVAQDWTSWVKRGILDFVCPMDYTASTSDLVENKLSGQLDRVRGAIPVYAGLGAFVMKSPSQLIDQINASRNAGADGFVAFAYFSGELDKWLPELRGSVTQNDPDPMPHWAPVTRWAFKGQGASAPLVSDASAPKTVAAGTRLEVGLTIGLAVATEPREGAEQAAAVLRQATEATARSPVGGYQPPGAPGASATGDQPRVSGRIVVETPAGATLAVVGAFEADIGASRTIRVSVPEGPFRIAVYGATQTRDGRREFVTRSAVLTGTKQ